MKHTYSAQFKPVSTLPERTRRAMAALYLKYYEGSSKGLFLSDLDRKTEALLVYSGDTLIGFTTQEIYRRSWQGHDVQVIYSGDTVVEQAHWGQQVLAFSWIENAGRIKQATPDMPLFWLLIVKGHRTYRYLPAFALNFFPHWLERNQALKTLADTLAVERFGSAYDPEKGIISFPESRGHLKEEFAHPTVDERSKQAVRYFLQRNPGYLRGEEMVCLCELGEHNLKPMSRRIFRRGAG